jgi:hypothetical protein
VVGVQVQCGVDQLLPVEVCKCDAALSSGDVTMLDGLTERSDECLGAPPYIYVMFQLLSAWLSLTAAGPQRSYSRAADCSSVGGGAGGAAGQH